MFHTNVFTQKEGVMYPVIISLLVTIAAYIFIGIYYLGTSRWPTSYQNKRVLFVTSHPDDECMFFGPTIRYFKSVGDVFLLCLTNGNERGLGEVRSEELQQSARRLGVPAGNLELVDSEVLQDDPKAEWDVAEVAGEVGKFAKLCKPDIIVTFDGYGVSGHANHIATAKGVVYAYQNHLISDNTLIYQLESVNIIRKYSSFLDCFASSASTVYNIASVRDVVNIQGAMKCHTSQLTWFRKLYVIFSRYMVVNTLRSVSV